LSALFPSIDRFFLRAVAASCAFFSLLKGDVLLNASFATTTTTTTTTTTIIA